MLSVTKALLKNFIVQLFQAVGLRNRDHVIAPCIAHYSFNSPFLITAAGIAEAGFKTVIRPELAEAFLLNAVPPAQHLLHRCR